MAKHGKKNEATPKLSEAEQLAEDIKLVDEAYRKAELKKVVTPKSTTPALDALKGRFKGSGKRRKG